MTDLAAGAVPGHWTRKLLAAAASLGLLISAASCSDDTSEDLDNRAEINTADTPNATEAAEEEGTTSAFEAVADELQSLERQETVDAEPAGDESENLAEEDTAEAPDPEPSPAPTQAASPAPSATPEPAPSPEPSMTVSQESAIRSAESYLRFTNFSRVGLIGQLEYEGYSTADAEFAVDSISVDWDAQAAGSATSYLNFTAFSRTGLIGQLEFEGFTQAQAIYGTDSAGADWYEQAAKSARSYLDFMGFSRQGLIDQLVYEGFTLDEATYGVDAVGL